MARSSRDKPGPSRKLRPSSSAAREFNPSAPPTLQQEIGKKHPFELPEHEAALNIARTASLLEAEFTRLFKRHGLSHATYNTLRILRGHHPAGVRTQTIGEQLITHVPDVTRLVDRLVNEGLARRAGDPEDRRVVLVHITPAGLRLLARLDEPVLALHRRQLGHMNQTDLRTLSRLLVAARCGCDPPARQRE